VNAVLSVVFHVEIKLWLATRRSREIIEGIGRDITQAERLVEMFESLVQVFGGEE